MCGISLMGEVAREDSARHAAKMFHSAGREQSGKAAGAVSGDATPIEEMSSMTPVESGGAAFQPDKLGAVHAARRSDSDDDALLPSFNFSTRPSGEGVDSLSAGVGAAVNAPRSVSPRTAPRDDVSEISGIDAGDFSVEPDADDFSLSEEAGTSSSAHPVASQRPVGAGAAASQPSAQREPIAASVPISAAAAPAPGIPLAERTAPASKWCC